MLRCGYRKGDNAEMAVLEYVDREGELRPARPPRLSAEAAAAVATSASEAPSQQPSLQDRLSAILRSQAAVRLALGEVPQLTPAFPAPHVAARAWSDNLWAPRSKAARLAGTPVGFGNKKAELK